MNEMMYKFEYDDKQKIAMLEWLDNCPVKKQAFWVVIKPVEK